MHNNIIQFDTIDSTNTYGLEHFENLGDKTVITALVQTKGRGRFNRIWISENRENIYLSIILKPQKKDFLPNLTQYMSVCCAKVIETYNVKAQIKYPNDVLVDNKKICGILCESFLKNNIIQGVVLGIGVNLNMSQSALDTIDRPAVSLNLITGKNIDRQEFFNKLVNEFFNNYDKVIQNGFAYFKEDYILRNNFLGKNVYVQQRDNDIKENFFAQKMDDNGNLVVICNDGTEKTIFSGDIIL